MPPTHILNYCLSQEKLLYYVPMRNDDFTFLEGNHNHGQRGREIIADHPEVRKLIGPYPLTFLWVLLFVGVQLSQAYWLSDMSWWWVVLVAYVFGAIISHSIFALIHDISHQLCFGHTFWDNCANILCNVGQGFPSAMGFKKYHMIHHSDFTRLSRDPDLPFYQEADWVGTSRIKKAIWYIFFMFSQLLRPMKLNIPLINGWILFNILFIITVDIAIYYFWGPKALAFLCLSTFFGLGLHPVGARWIQEHWVFKEGQETYSYYGPFNWPSFNIGYHVEHHDLPKIPWVHLPKLKKIAPEKYDHLYSHPSWTKLLLRFLFDRNISLYTRYARR